MRGVYDGLTVVELAEGMTLELRWTDGGDRFGEYNLPVFGPPCPPSRSPK
jgi:hypothetical protein